VAKLKLEAEVEHVRDIKEIAKSGVVAVPGLMLNGQGNPLGVCRPGARLVEWLKEARNSRQ